MKIMTLRILTFIMLFNGLNANDLMKVGQVLCNFGERNGKGISSESKCNQMFQIP
jgi:hypothetical protein